MGNGQMHYNVVDGQTGEIVAGASTRARANRIADRLNLQYGAHRYRVPLLPIVGNTHHRPAGSLSRQSTAQGAAKMSHPTRIAFTLFMNSLHTHGPLTLGNAAEESARRRLLAMELYESSSKRMFGLTGDSMASTRQTIMILLANAMVSRSHSGIHAVRAALGIRDNL